MRTLWRWLVAGLVLLLGRRKRRPVAALPPGPSPPPPASRRAENAVLTLLALAAAASVAFLVVYAGSADTQLLGLALGGAFAFLAVAAVVAGRGLVPQEEVSEPYPEARSGEDAEHVAEIVRSGAARLTRRRLLTVAAGGAGAALGAALLAPALSLGPALETDVLRRTPWRAGRRLVNADGEPVLASQLDERSFLTAFPEGARRDQLGAPLVVVKLDPFDLELPPEREGWAPDGVVAYSKICTHAGCAVSMYRSPKFEPTAPRPGLVCPCHYSTFDPAAGGRVLFGPAGRPLPQLPLAVEDDVLVAAGSFSGPLGPSWWGVRQA